MTGSQPAFRKLQRAVQQLRLVPAALKLVWEGSGRWTLAWGALLVAQGLLPVGIVFLTRDVVDALVAAVEAGGSPAAIRAVAVPAAALAFLYLAREGLGSAATWVRTVQADRVRDHLADRIHRKSVEADLAFYDSADFYDHLHRARSEAVHRPVSLLEGMGSLAQGSITLVAMLGVLLPYGAWLPLALLLSTLPALGVVVRFTLKEHAWWLRRTPDERRSRYLSWLLTAESSAAELRLFELGSPFRRDFETIRQGLREERGSLAREKAVSQLVASVLALSLGGLALVWMGWRAVRGEVTLGDVALFVQAFHQGQGLLRELLGHLGQILANALFLESLFEFLALPSSIRDPVSPRRIPATLVDGLRLEGVSFSYPGRRRPTLTDFSLHLRAGELTALVGQNGAGKSTLIKLICRFYDPQEGRILLDGVDLRELAVEDLRRACSVLFQRPVRFQDTAARNVAYGDLSSEPGRDRIAAAARAAGADEMIERLREGYDTVLGKIFAEGVELSVGEWQRLSLARAFLRQTPILLLDEPTSAMDSWAAAEWMERCRQLAAGKTALLITHRFTTAMRADRIHVLGEGQILESGSHQELLDRGGLYARAWTRQREVGPVSP